MKCVNHFIAFNFQTECEDPEKLIEVSYSLTSLLLRTEATLQPDWGSPYGQVRAPWQWLGLDVRGPLPQTLNGHRYILTVTDYFSKWVEAVPVESCLPSYVAKHIVDIIAHFGFPVRILSRLPHDIVQKVSVESQKTELDFDAKKWGFFLIRLLDQQRTERAAEDHHRSGCPSSADGQRRLDHTAADWQVCASVHVFVADTDENKSLLIWQYWCFTTCCSSTGWWTIL